MLRLKANPTANPTAHSAAHSTVQQLGSGWFIYALGGGWGHLNRSLSLARVAAKDRPIHLLTNSPYAQKIAASVQTSNLTLHQLPSHISIAQARASIISLLQSIEYDVLIVDTFPRGLVGELAEIIPQRVDICRVLVHRDLNVDYVKAKAIASFVSQHYDGILIPGEANPPLAHLAQAKATAPWLSRSPADLPEAQALRRRWNISESTPLVIVCGAGQPQELDFFGEIVEQIAGTFSTVTVRCLSAICPTTCSPDLWLYHWPGMDILQLADGVVGSGGYNLVHECAALNIPLVAFALPRRYDRQARRIRQYGHCVKSREAAIAALAHLLNKGKSSQVCDDHLLDREVLDYENGIAAAIAHIESWRRDKLAQAQQ